VIDDRRRQEEAERDDRRRQEEAERDDWRRQQEAERQASHKAMTAKLDAMLAALTAPVLDAEEQNSSDGHQAQIDAVAVEHETWMAQHNETMAQHSEWMAQHRQWMAAEAEVHRAKMASIGRELDYYVRLNEQTAARERINLIRRVTPSGKCFGRC
jgi:hypothetical protein